MQLIHSLLEHSQLLDLRLTLPLDLEVLSLIDLSDARELSVVDLEFRDLVLVALHGTSHVNNLLLQFVFGLKRHLDRQAVDIRPL